MGSGLHRRYRCYCGQLRGEYSSCSGDDYRVTYWGSGVTHARNAPLLRKHFTPVGPEVPRVTIIVAVYFAWLQPHGLPPTSMCVECGAVHVCIPVSPLRLSLTCYSVLQRARPLRCRFFLAYLAWDKVNSCADMYTRQHNSPHAQQLALFLC